MWTFPAALEPKGAPARAPKASARPPTSERTNSGSMFSRAAANAISSVMTPCLAYHLGGRGSGNARGARKRGTGLPASACPRQGPSHRARSMLF